MTGHRWIGWGFRRATEPPQVGPSSADADNDYVNDEEDDNIFAKQ